MNAMEEDFFNELDPIVDIKEIDINKRSFSYVKNELDITQKIKLNNIIFERNMQKDVIDVYLSEPLKISLSKDNGFTESKIICPICKTEFSYKEKNRIVYMTCTSLLKHMIFQDCTYDIQKLLTKDSPRDLFASKGNKQNCYCPMLSCLQLFREKSNGRRHFVYKHVQLQSEVQLVNT